MTHPDKHDECERWNDQSSQAAIYQHRWLPLSIKETSEVTNINLWPSAKYITYQRDGVY